MSRPSTLKQQWVTQGSCLIEMICIRSALLLWAHARCTHDTCNPVQGPSHLPRAIAVPTIVDVELATCSRSTLAARTSHSISQHKHHLRMVGVLQRTASLMSRGAGGEGGKDKKAAPTAKDIVHAETNFWVFTAPADAAPSSPFARNEQIVHLFNLNASHCDNCE